MTPLLLLAIVLCLTAAAVIDRSIKRRKRRAALSALAREWHMHFSAEDRFGLSDGVAQRLPVPGAADVRVLDLIYASEQDAYRYYFSVEFTVGVTRSKRCAARVGTLTEHKKRSGCAGWSNLRFADETGDLVAQYSLLHDRMSRA